MTRSSMRGRAPVLIGLIAAVTLATGRSADAQPSHKPAVEHGAPAPYRHRPPPINQPAPSVEVVIPLDRPASDPCADQTGSRSRAWVEGLERFERETSGEHPPADLGC